MAAPMRPTLVSVIAALLCLLAFQASAWGQVDPNQDAMEKARRMIRRARSYGPRYVERMRESEDDGLLLESTLSSLYSELGYGPDRMRNVELLGALAGRGWRKRESEPTRDFVERLTDEVRQMKSGDAHLFFEAQEQFQLLSGEPWPYDWRSDSEPWLALSAGLVDAEHATDPSVWRKLAERHPKHAKLYRLAYLAVLDARGKSLADKAFIAPLLEETMPVINRIVHHAAVLRVLSKSAEAADSEYRVSLRNRLVSLSREHANDVGPFAALAFLSNTPESYFEREPLQSALLEALRPDQFTGLSGQAGFDDAFRRRLFLGQQVSFDWDGVPLNRVVQQLEAKVALPLWIEPSIRDDATPITMSHSRRWIDVLEALLEPTPHELVMFRDELIWIGPREKRTTAAEILAAASAKIPTPDDSHAAETVVRLLKPTDVSLRDTPFADVCAYVKDYSSLPIHDLRNDGVFKNVTLDVNDFPAYLALELICRQAGADWTCFGPVVVVGTPKRIAAASRSEEDFRLALARLDASDSPLLVRLNEQTSLEFIETPIIDVASYLHDMHAVKIELAEGVDPSQPVTAELNAGPAFGWALESLLLDFNLTTQFEDDKIIIAPRPKPD